MKKQQFEEKINFIPSWVKNENDLKKYARHLHYRLLQAQEENDYLCQLNKLSEEQEKKLCEIRIKYDEFYEN